MIKKFSIESKNLEEEYIKNGYLLIKNSFEKKYINNLSNLILDKVKKLEKKYNDYHDICNKIMDDFEKSPEYDELIFQENLKKLMIRFLGQDLCVLNYTALWVNTPTNKNPVLKKNEHVDSWTGTGINTIFLKIFLTDCDQYNGMTVFPGTHLHGLYPVKNRTLNLPEGVTLGKGLNLKIAKKGDVLIWHPLLVHSTTGHSPKNKRVSFTLRYSSTETDFTSQERALGYKTVSVSVGNIIKRYIGNDGLQPFRVYGGVAAIDKRLSKLYNKKYYKKNI
jgi:hypothetical protein